MKGLGVIIPSKTASNFIACAKAVRKHEPSCQIVLIDDGMDLDWLPAPELMPCYGHLGEKPFIFARNINKGITSEFTVDSDVLILNDDAILETQGGFTAMQKLAVDFPEYGLIGPLTNVSGNVEQLRKTGTSLRETLRTLPFLCVFVPRGTIDRVGLLDERFTAYGWEDDDYCKRVRDAGLKIGIFEGCFVDHASLRSTFRGNPHAAGDIEAGREIYLQKWGSIH